MTEIEPNSKYCNRLGLEPSEIVTIDPFVFDRLAFRLSFRFLLKAN